MIKINHQGLELIIIKQPQKKDLRSLVQTANLDPAILTELARPTFHPKVEIYNNQSLFIFRFPEFFPRHQLKPAEVDFIVTDRSLIVVQYTSFSALEKLILTLQKDPGQQAEFLGQNSSAVLLKILDVLFRSLFAHTDHIGQKVDKLEERIFRGREEKLVRAISLLRREAIDFRRILSPNIKILEELQEKTHSVLTGNYHQSWKKIYHLNSRLLHFINGQIDTLLVLHETNESLLSNKISTIMRVLTIFSVIVFPLTLFASIWGMNVENMPLIGHVYDFWVVLTLMGLATLGMLVIFKIKKWI